ncbi:MAG: hypothetical protein PHG65_03315, partial [Kiritimatiellae bacterium]|nr:hypothetical protein [Kiritimatiellia bacterium]
MINGQVNMSKRAWCPRSLCAGLTAVACLSACGPASAAFHGWALGTDSASGSIILHSTNGHDWSTQTTYSSSDPDLWSIDGVPGGVLWTVGMPSDGYATIRRSADQGETWVRQGSSNTLPNVELLKIRAVNESILWSVGVSGTVVVTTNGGTDWANVSLPGVGQMLQSVDAVDAQTAWVGGASDGQGFAILYHTINGGATWTHQMVGGITNVEALLGIRVLDANNAWAVGGAYQNIIQTTNAGASWVTRHMSASYRDGNELDIDPNGG